MSSKLSLATYGLVRGDAAGPRRAEPNTSAAAGTHQNTLVSKTRSRAAQLLQSDLAPPMMTVHDVSLDRHLGNRYVPHQTPFATLACSEFLLAEDIQSLARVFEHYNVLPNNQQIETVNDPDVVNLASSPAGRDRDRREASGGSPPPPPPSDQPVPSGVKRSGTTPRASPTTAQPPGGYPTGTTGTGAAAAGGATTGSGQDNTALQASPALSHEGRKLGLASRKGAARVLETKLTRDEDDTALSVEWVVELLLDIIATRMDAKEAETAATSALPTGAGRTDQTEGAGEDAGGGYGDGAQDARRASASSLVFSPPSRGWRGRNGASAAMTAVDPYSTPEAQRRAAKLRAFRSELRTWITPLAQNCDPRRQSSVFDGCRRQQQMLLQYHRGMLEAALLRVRRRIDLLPAQAAGEATTTTTTANTTAAGTRMGKGFSALPTSSLFGTPRVTPLPLPDDRRPDDLANPTTVGNSATRRSPAAINFLGSFALPEPLPERGLKQDNKSRNNNGNDDSNDDNAAAGTGLGHDSQSLEDSIVSPCASSRGKSVSGPQGGGGGGDHAAPLSRSTAATAALDVLLPRPTTTTTTAAAETEACSAANATTTSPVDEELFLPMCYLKPISTRGPNSAAADLAREEAEQQVTMTERQRRARQSLSLVTSAFPGELDGSECATRPPSASERGGGGGGGGGMPLMSSTGSPIAIGGGGGGSASSFSTALPPATVASVCTNSWLEALADLPAWSETMRTHLIHERGALGTQTLEDALVSLATAQSNGASGARHGAAATSTTHNANSNHTANSTNGTSSPLRVASFRRPAGYNRLACLPRLHRDAPCRVVCWTDLSNNFILDYEGNDHQGGFLEQTYVRGPSMMLEGDEPQHAADGAAGASPGAAGSGGDDDDDDMDGNGEDALLSAIHGGARRRRRAAGRGMGGGGGTVTASEDLAQQTAIVTDVATFAEELKGLHRQAADHVVVTENGALIITASKDGVVKTWDGHFGQFRANLLNVGTAWVLAMTLIRSDQILLVATSNAELTLVELATTNVVHKYRGCTSLLTALRSVVLPDAQQIARFGMKPGECGPHRIGFADGTSAEGYHSQREREVELTKQTVSIPVQPIEGFVSPTAFYFCAETSFGFFGTSEGAVGCVDLSGELCRTASLVAKGMLPLSLLFSAHAHAPGTTVTGVCYSLTTGCVVSTAHDGTITRIPFVRDGHTGQFTVGAPARVAQFQPKPARFLVFHPHARLMATSHCDRRVHLWSLTRTSVELVHQFPQETQDIISIVFLPREERIAMLLSDHSLRVFDVRGHRPSAIITARTNGDQQLQDMASVALKLSASDPDGCVGYHANSRRLVCALRSPILYVPAGGPRVEGSKRDAVEAENKKRQRRRSSVASWSKGEGENDKADDDDNDDDDDDDDPSSLSDSDGNDELAAVKALQRMSGESLSAPPTPSALGGSGGGLLGRRESLELVERLEQQQRDRQAARLAKKQRLAEEALLARRLAPHTTHHRGAVVEVVIVPERLEAHSFTSDRWKVWSLESGTLLREMELPREVRRAFPRFRRATFVCGGWSTAACTRLLLGGYDGVMTTVDPETGLVVMTEQLKASAAAGSPTRAKTTATRAGSNGVGGGGGANAAGTVAPPLSSPSAAAAATTGNTITNTTTNNNGNANSSNNNGTGGAGVPAGGGVLNNTASMMTEQDVTVITSEKQRAFVCAGRHCFVRRYHTNVLDAQGAEEFTNLTLSLPVLLSTSITACCVVRDTHVCLGTMDGRLLFYRLVDGSSPYAEEKLRESYPDGEQDIGGVLGLAFLNEKNQGLVVAVTDLGVMHVYAYLKGTFVGRLRLCRAHECHLTRLHFHRATSLLVLGDSLGRVRLFDLIAFVSESTNFKRAIRACGVFQGGTSEVTALALLSRPSPSAFGTSDGNSSSNNNNNSGGGGAAAATALIDTDKDSPGYGSSGRSTGYRNHASRLSLAAGSTSLSVAANALAPVWLVVGARDGNVRLFCLKPAMTAAGGLGGGLSFAATTTVSMTGRSASVTGSNTTGGQQRVSAVMMMGSGPRTSADGGTLHTIAGQSTTSHAFAESATNASAVGGVDGDVAGQSTLTTSAAAAAAAAATGSFASPFVRIPVLVGLFGCDVWRLGDDSTYSVGVSLPVEELSARQKESQVVLEEVLKRSKPSTTAATVTVGAPAAGAAAAATMATNAVPSKTAESATKAAALGAGQFTAAGTKRATPSSAANKKASPTSVALAIAAQSQPMMPATATMSRTVQALLPTVKLTDSGVTTVEESHANGMASLPPSVALGTRLAQAGRPPIDMSQQRRISPPSGMVQDHDEDGHADQHQHAPPLLPHQDPSNKSRRSTTAAGIASVLCTDPEVGSSNNSTTSATGAVVRSRHATLLLAAAANSSGDLTGASSAADATFAAAHKHMSSTTPNPLLRSYPVPLLRKLGVVLPNQEMPDGGDDAELPADLAFDPVRLRAFFRGEQKKTADPNSTGGAGHDDLDDAAAPRETEDSRGTQPKETSRNDTTATSPGRRLTAVMGPGGQTSDSSATVPSFFLTDVPGGQRTSSCASSAMTPIHESDSLSPKGSLDAGDQSGRDMHHPPRSGGGGRRLLIETPSISTATNSTAPTTANSFRDAGLPDGVADPLAHTRAALGNTNDDDADAKDEDNNNSHHSRAATKNAQLPPRPSSRPDAAGVTSTLSNTTQLTPATDMTFAATTGQRGLASLQRPTKVQPCVMRAASASSPRSASRLAPMAVPSGSPTAISKTVTVVTTAVPAPNAGPGGGCLSHTSPSILLTGMDDALLSPLTITLGSERARSGNGLNVILAQSGSPTSSAAFDVKAREAETVAFPDGLPPAAVLEERRDQLMLAHLARQLDHLQPKGCAEGAFMQNIERTWRRRRGDAAARAAALSSSPGSATPASGTAQGLDGMLGEGSEMASDVLGGTTAVRLGATSTTTPTAIATPIPGAVHARSSGAQPTSGRAGSPFSPRTASSMGSTARLHPGGGGGNGGRAYEMGETTEKGGFTGLNLGLLALPTESIVVGNNNNNNTTSDGDARAASRGKGVTGSSSASSSPASNLPAHERMQQHIQQLRKAEVQALRDRIAARDEQEAHRHRRPGAPTTTTTTMTTAQAAAPQKGSTVGANSAGRVLPRGRDELPLISARQRLGDIDVALPSTLVRDEGAKLQLRQLQALSGATKGAPAALSSSAPTPQNARW